MQTDKEEYRVVFVGVEFLLIIIFRCYHPYITDVIFAGIGDKFKGDIPLPKPAFDILFGR